MAPSICHLPNGQTLTVTPVFGGVSFKPNELKNNRSSFPPGWVVVLNEEDPPRDDDHEWEVDARVKKQHIHRYTKPTLQNDHIFISTISNPSSADFRPASSPTRQLAMMLWASLYWYFHQPEPQQRLDLPASTSTPEAGRPKGEWTININREGIFKRKNLLAKFERMGLIATADSSVGTELELNGDVGCRKMFVTRRAFWQIDARIFLFTLASVQHSPFPSGSPVSSRPSSPKRASAGAEPFGGTELQTEEKARLAATTMLQGATPGQFHSNSHLPTYYPPHPPLYVYTNNIRHPIRPKPYKQGETFYTRYIPSLGQYLSFRVASLSPTPPSQHGPWSIGNHVGSLSPGVRVPPKEAVSESIVPTIHNNGFGPNDVDLLHKWMNIPRVAHSWLETGPIAHQEEFLRKALSSQHSVPVIRCFDGKPFGYFEIYWVKEDKLGSYLGRTVGDWDRGVHLLVGEQEFRGPHRVRVWLSAIVHYCWVVDMRTECVMLEPRVDNDKMVRYCTEAGFFKEREVTFPHKQSNLFKIYRDTWEKPAL